MNHRVDGDTLDAEPPPDLRRGIARVPRLPHGRDYPGRKYAVGDTLTTRLTPFRNRISTVCQLCPNKEMRWIDTERDIASVKNELVRLKRATVNQPSRSVRADVLADPKLAIAISVANP